MHDMKIKACDMKMLKQMNEPSGKGNVMVRMTTWLAMALMMTLIYASPVAAYDPPSPSPDWEDFSAEYAESNPYLYDLYTNMQVAYWGAVMDRISGKFNQLADGLAALDSAKKMWELIEDNNVDIDEYEAQILCLFVQKGDEEPDDDAIADWPSDGWPSCGGVLETMFGPGIIDYLEKNKDNDNVLRIYGRLLTQMGISPKSVEDTINRRIAMADEEASLLLPGQSVTASQGFTAYEHQGYVTAYGQSAGCSDADDCPEDPKEVEFPQDASGFAMVCSTPATNIKVYEGCGPLCTVTRIIMGLLNTASEGLVNATVANNTFQNAVLAALTLYITIYGAMVVLGMVQVALGDAVMRIFKMSIVAMLLSSETVMTFFHMGRCFFIEGTTYLVNGVLSIGVEAVASIGAPGDINIESLYPGMSNVDLCGSSFSNTDSAQGPLVILESLLGQVFSPHMAINFAALAFSKIEGFIMAAFLLWVLFIFMMSILGAVTIYLTALIGQYLLLSLMPLFVVFSLFQRTEHLFKGWLSQLITYSLTPIFLFAYISLFVVIISAALAQILDVQICLAKWFSLMWVFDVVTWQYFDWETNMPMSELPFGWFELLILMLLVYLLHEFEKSVENLAKDIGGSYVNFGGAGAELQRGFKGIVTAPINATKQGVRMAADVAMKGIGSKGGGAAAAASSVPRGGPGGGGSGGGGAPATATQKAASRAGRSSVKGSAPRTGPKGGTP